MSSTLFLNVPPAASGSTVARAKAGRAEASWAMIEGHSPGSRTERSCTSGTAMPETRPRRYCWLFLCTSRTAVLSAAACLPATATDCPGQDGLRLGRRGARRPACRGRGAQARMRLTASRATARPSASVLAAKLATSCGPGGVFCPILACLIPLDGPATYGRAARNDAWHSTYPHSDKIRVETEQVL